MPLYKKSDFMLPTFLFLFKADLPSVDRTLPLVLFGVLGITAGILALWLPETLFSPMPQTVQQVENWPEDYKVNCCRKPNHNGDDIEMKNKEKEATL